MEEQTIKNPNVPSLIPYKRLKKRIDSYVGDRIKEKATEIVVSVIVFGFRIYLFGF